MIKQSFLLVLLFFFVSTIHAQTTSKSGSLADLSFIAGHWKATPEGRTIEAVWLAPAADNIAGFMRMIREDKVFMYEILAYEQSERGLVSLVKHFQPGLIAQEEKDAPVRYNFVEASKGRVTFEQEGKSVRVLYEQRSRDQFIIALGKQEQGKWVFTPLFDFTRVK